MVVDDDNDNDNGADIVLEVDENEDARLVGADEEAPPAPPPLTRKTEAGGELDPEVVLGRSREVDHKGPNLGYYIQLGLPERRHGPQRYFIRGKGTGEVQTKEARPN